MNSTWDNSRINYDTLLADMNRMADETKKWREEHPPKRYFIRETVGLDEKFVDGMAEKGYRLIRSYRSVGSAGVFVHDDWLMPDLTILPDNMFGIIEETGKQADVLEMNEPKLDNLYVPFVPLQLSLNGQTTEERDYETINRANRGTPTARKRTRVCGRRRRRDQRRGSTRLGCRGGHRRATRSILRIRKCRSAVARRRCPSKPFH